MHSKRIKLVQGKQRELIERVKTENCFTWVEFASALNLNAAYLSNELKQETRTLRLDIFNKLCNLINADYSPFIVNILDCKWGQRKGGRNSNIGRRCLKKIKKLKLDENFAELIGAYLGDGTLTKYFMRITADKRYCLSYMQYLKKLAKSTFGLEATIRTPSKRNAGYLEIRSKQLCDYFQKNLSLHFGNKIKNKSKIPNEILSNEKLTKACLRGLMDTDGSISKRGTYMCLEFTSRNPVLLEQVCQIGKQFGVFTHQNKEQVGTNSWPKIERYFKTIGSSNKIHIIRFCERFQNRKLLYKTDLLRYFKKYDGIPLPFMGSWSSG